MADVKQLYGQYQISKNCVETWERDVSSSRGIIESAKDRFSVLEEKLKTAVSVRSEQETALAKEISTQISERRAVLTRANRMLRKGDVETSYLILTGQEPEAKVKEEQPTQLVQAARPDKVKGEQPTQLVQAARPEVVIRMATGMLYGVDRENDKFVWKYETPYCWPVFAQDEGRVFVADYKTLVSLDRESGREISRQRIADSCLDALLQDEGVLFVASNNDISAYDVENLQKLWKKRIPYTVELAKSGESLFAACRYNLFALEPKTGKVKWDSCDGAYLIAGGANNEGSVYTAKFGRRVIIKLDKYGKQMWENRTDIPVTVMKEHNGALYLGSREHINALDADTGKEMWRKRIGHYDFFTWQIGEAQGRLEVTVTEPYYSKESKVITLNPKNGEQI